MKNPFSDPRWVAQIISLLVLLGLVALYFFWYVPNQGDYFAKRNFRVLALTAEQIKKTLEAFPGALKIAAQSVEKSESGAGGATALEDRVKQAMDLIPALILIQNPKVEDAGKGWTNFGISMRADSDWVEFEYRSFAGTNTNRLVTIRAKTDMNRFVGSPREFDGLLVALESGEVVFRKLPAGLQIQKLNKAREEQPSVFGSNPVQRATTLVPVSLAGDTYKFFTQPLQISAPMPSGERNNWLVCGLVRAGRFNSESLEVDYIFLILFIFLVLFAALSVVFPKVGFAGPSEPLRRRTVLMLAKGTLGGAMLLTVLLLDVTVYPFMEDYLDDPSEELSKNIRANFREEISRLHEVLSALHVRKIQDPDLPANLTEMLKHPAVKEVMANSPARFDMVFWVGTNGMQSAKWTVRRTITPFIPVRERSYFQDALNDRHTTYSRREKGTNLFWLEPIYSLSTGVNSVVLSIRSASGGVPVVAAIESRLQSLIRPVLPPGYGFCVVTDDGEVLFHSEVERNLRENLFEECEESARLRSAVLGRASRQFDLYYLGRTHHFFVAPIENLPWTLVVFRDERFLSAANFEVVLVSLLLLVLWLLAPTVLAFLVLAMPWFIRLALGRPTTLPVLPRWLWPDHRHGKAYLYLSGLNFLLAVAAMIVLGTFHQSPWRVATCAIAGAMVGTLTACYRLTRPRSGGDLQVQGNPAFARWCYVALLISLLLLVAVVPAFAAFKIAVDQRIKLFAKQGQFNYARALGERAERLKRDNQEAPGQDDLEARLRLNTDKLPWDVYAGTNLNIIPQDDWPTSTLSTKKLMPAPFDWLFASLMPLHDLTTVGARSLAADRAEDNSWYWTDEPSKGLVFHVNNYRENASLRLTTPGVKVPIIEMGLLTLGVLSLALLFPVCFIAHRVCLINLPQQDISATDAINAARIQENILVLGLKEGDKSLLDRLGSDIARRRRADCVEIDCRHESFDAPEKFKTQHHVILDHFEHRWDNPDLNQRKWILLDWLTSQAGRFVIVSMARNPWQMRIAEANQPAANASDASGRKSDPNPWTELWRDFRWVCLDAPDCERQVGYRAIWANCSRDERFALFHVAKHGFLHSRNPQLPILLSRRLLINDRGLRLMDEGFHRFVRNAIEPEEVRTYDHQVASRGWDVIKGPLYFALIALALLMFVTQPEIYKIILGAVTAFAAGPPAILKLLSLFEADKEKRAAA